MGAGKTTFIEKFRENLEGFIVYDLDEEVAKSLKMAPKKLGEFINTNGLEAFRIQEANILESLLRLRSKKIIALGGGTLEAPGVMELADQYRLVFLDTSFEVCLSRIKNDLNRPVAQKPLEELKALYEKRRKIYLKSKLVLSEQKIKEIDTISSLVHNLEGN